MIRTFILIATAGLALAQTPAFEVASIHLHQGAVRNIGRSSSGGPEMTFVANTMRDLIMAAYDLRAYQIDGANGWMTSETDRYDIATRAPGDSKPSEEQIRGMLQTLLAERFGFKFHRDTREMAVYSLVIAKSGAKLKENNVRGRNVGVSVSVDGPETEMKFMTATMQVLVRQLTSIPGVDRPVLDKTGLTGTYDFQLKTVLDPATRVVTGPSGESIFTTVEEQLGLQLEPQKAPIEVLVIDHVERPSEN
jgi:uncharacterized protein (TIGR03435 family)